MEGNVGDRVVIDPDVPGFKRFLLRNRSYGKKECVAIGVRDFGLGSYKAESLITAWIEDGTLKTIKEGEKTQNVHGGRPRLIVTSSRRKNL